MKYSLGVTETVRYETTIEADSIEEAKATLFEQWGDAPGWIVRNTELDIDHVGILED